MVTTFCPVWCYSFNVHMPDSTSYSGNTITFELSSLGDGVRTSDLEDLKANAIKCLTDGFFKKLLDLEEVYLILQCNFVNKILFLSCRLSCSRGQKCGLVLFKFWWEEWDINWNSEQLLSYTNSLVLRVYVPIGQFSKISCYKYKRTMACLNASEN